MNTAKDDLDGVLARLSDQQRRFAEGICIGMSGVEAARYAGSQAKDNNGLAVAASRWRRRPDIRRAIELLRAQHAIEADDIWDLTVKALRELITDKFNPNARAKACELMAKLLGKLAPEKHLHAHLHAETKVKEFRTAMTDLIGDPVLGPLLEAKALLSDEEWVALGPRILRLVGIADVEVLLAGQS